MLDVIGLQMYVQNARGSKPWVCSSKDHDHQGPSAACHSDRLCMPAWSALQDFQDLAGGIRALGSEAATNPPISVFSGHPFAKSLLNIAFELVELACHGTKVNFVQFDQYTHFLLQIIASDRESYGPHILVATQIYMEIWDALDGHTDRGMLEASITIARSAETFRKFEDFKRQCISADDGGLSMRIVCPGAKICLKTKVNQSVGARLGWTYQSGASQPILFIPSNVLAALPIYCGRRAFLEQVDLTVHGMELLNSDQFLLAGAHLYKAATVQGSLDLKWDDMDFLISRQNTRGPFVRAWDSCESVTIIAKQYHLALGIPLSQLAGKNHPAIPSDAVCEKKSTKMFMTSASISGEWSRPLENETPMRALYDCARNFMLYCKVPDGRLVTQWDQTKKLTPCQMLFITQEALVEDELSLNFDFFSFARQVIGMAMAASDVFVDRLEQDCIPERLEKRAPKPYLIINEILWEAANAEREDSRRSSTVLHVAGKMMCDFISLYGRDGLDEAMPISSGHIPDAKKPCVHHDDKCVGFESPTRYPGLIEIETLPIFETGHVATEIETEVLRQVVLQWESCFAQRPIRQNEIMSAVDAIVLDGTDRLHKAGILRYAHVTLGPDLRPDVRSIAVAEWRLFHEKGRLDTGLVVRGTADSQDLECSAAGLPTETDE